MPTLKMSQRCSLGCGPGTRFQPKESKRKSLRLLFSHHTARLDQFCCQSKKKVHFKDLGVKGERPRRFSLAFFRVENG
jgi:hypothetical protein